MKPLINRSLLVWSFREIKQGNLWPIAIALILIVSSVFALSALAYRFDQVITLQSKNALTADIIFQSANPLPTSLLTHSTQNQIKTSKYTRFNTMAFSETQMQLVTVKAVDSNYPLRGDLTLRNNDQIQKQVNENELWLDTRLFQSLQVEIGDEINIGDADFIISGEIAQEPGLNFNPFQQMPSIYIHQNDIQKTGAIQVGSRVSYRLLINATEQQISSLKNSTSLTASDRWVQEHNQGRASDIFNKTSQYLSLTILIVILMASMTLTLTCQSYVIQRKKTIAMMKSLGASKAFINHWLLTQILILSVLGLIFGWGFGILIEFLLRIPLSDVLPKPLPSYGINPFLLSSITCIVVGTPSLGIPLFHLLKISPSEIIQDNKQTHKIIYLLVMIPLLFLLFLYKGSWTIWIMLGSILILFTALAIISLYIVKLINRFKLTTSMKLAISRIQRSSTSSGVQFGALGLSLMLIAIIWLIRTDLLSEWQQTLPEDAPNVFALNIETADKDNYLALIDQQKLIRSDAFPITRGRITTINHQDAKVHAGGEDKSNALRRELNFTWANELPETNKVLKGSWTKSNGVSVEEGVAKELNINLGDQLEFMINGQTIKASVNSIREVNWREMKPNFFFIFTPDILKSTPVTWLVSFQAPKDSSSFLNQLARDYKTVSLMDLRAMFSKVQSLLRQITSSVTMLSSVAIIAGLLLIFTLLRLSLSQRQKEIRLYRTLGSSQKTIEKTLWIEYGIMALVSSIVACFGAELSTYALMKWGFELTSNIHWLVWLALPILTILTLSFVLYTLIKKLIKPITGFTN